MNFRVKYNTALKTIHCKVCGEPCGKDYPDTWENPGFREGKGENFIVEGEWHCSQYCAEMTSNLTWAQILNRDPVELVSHAFTQTLLHESGNLLACACTWFNSMETIAYERGFRGGEEKSDVRINR